ncbi:glutamate--cysteine ligase regulatory subunit-like [Teleopsis dalmanni]|uniref:glutamate--cysteine ligase regulatory subunit n=1 Tax=Teleopsis dalmanni TaxID=139649 RepID=UPI0018CD2E4A|nr:glutamate--cysteine ligase regulatory subunit [Teleopsis dalmanni]XP_037954275.1 glutamate--cysteine ligase regulatory subunit-like [Teleopsis dalmanni]
MIPVITSNVNFQKLVISTGNILNTSNQQIGSRSNEELIDGLKLTLQANDINHVVLEETKGQVLRATQELNEKLTENQRPDISIGAKIFLNKNSKECIEQAITTLLQILNVEHVDNVVLAYHPIPQNVINSAPTTPVGTPAGEKFKWHSRNDQTVRELKELWSTLETFALNKQIKQLGISDLDIETLSQLHAGARVPPTIAQINLSSCCVVPPALQEFCNKHDIQLLTHSDPEILVSDEQFIIPGFTVDWTLRYQVHVRCRGVLTAKGFILGAHDVATKA